MARPSVELGLDHLALYLYFSKFGAKSRKGSVKGKGVLPMALKPCAHCGEDIEEDATVCPHCHTFGPFETTLPAASVDTLSDLSVERNSHGDEPGGGWFKDLLKYVAFDYAFGCGGFIIAIAIAIVFAVIISRCGDGGPEEFDCRELHDWGMDLTGWEDTDIGQPLDDFRILEIIPDPDADTVAGYGAFCQAVAQTTDGEHLIWYELEDDGTVSIVAEPLP